ncbi:MAG: hypothetical protein JW395_2467 [Nitrospira sp.]|nr:hypothetical protein [Nitrospira sp.]
MSLVVQILFYGKLSEGGVLWTPKEIRTSYRKPPAVDLGNGLGPLEFDGTEFMGLWLTNLSSFWVELGAILQLWVAGILLAFALAAGIASVRALIAARRLSVAIRILGTVPPPSQNARRAGLSQVPRERLAVAVRGFSKQLQVIWKSIDDATEEYASSTGDRGYFLTTPARELLTSDRVIGTMYPARGLGYVPGILTSLGLLGTFVALLLGLQGVRVSPDGAVLGIGDLINRLSGKFVTSIAALGLSVVFLMFDHYVLQVWLQRKRARLVDAVDRLLPFLPSSRILLDVQRLAVQQAVSLGNISSDFVAKFTEAFKGDLGALVTQGVSASMATELQDRLIPVLDRIEGTMGGLGETVKRLESAKQDSVVAQLEALVASLERSIRSALLEMGSQFRDALQGSTKDEFSQLAGVVSGSAGVLQSMTVTFAKMETSLQAVIDEARATTTGQLKAGSEQTERLNQLVEGLMTRLNEAASHNFESVGAVLAEVVSRLSDRVTGLSEEMVQAVRAAAERSESAAESTMARVGQWSGRTSEDLERILSGLKARAEDFDRASETLRLAQHGVAALLLQSGDGLKAMGQAASDVRAYSAGISGLQREVVEGQKIQLRLATTSEDAIGKILAASVQQAALLGQHRELFEQYRSVLEGLDKELAATLDTIISKMGAYNAGVERSFSEIVKTSNDYFPKIVASLRDASTGLEEQLSELAGVIETNVGRMRPQ